MKMPESFFQTHCSSLGVIFKANRAWGLKLQEVTQVTRTTCRYFLSALRVRVSMCVRVNACVRVYVSPSQDRDSSQIFRTCRTFRNPLNFTTSFQESRNQGLKDMTCLRSHHSPEVEEEVFSETVLPAPQHLALLRGGGHSLPTAQPFDAENGVGVPSIGPHLGPGSVLCTLHKLCHSFYSSPTSSKRGILIYI